MCTVVVGDVKVVPFYSDDPSLNPAEVYDFTVKLSLETNENKQKEAGAL